MAKIKWEGLDKLQKKLKENVTMNDVKRVVRQNGADLQQKIQEKAEFTKGYQTGQTKRSVNLEIKDGGFTAESGPTTEYAPCLKIGRNIWQHMFENRAKSVEILANIAQSDLMSNVEHDIIKRKRGILSCSKRLIFQAEKAMDLRI